MIAAMAWNGRSKHSIQRIYYISSYEQHVALKNELGEP